jgi:hypothetical protein
MNMVDGVTAFVAVQKKNTHNPAMQMAAAQMGLSIALNKYMSLEGEKVKETTNKISDINTAMALLRQYTTNGKKKSDGTTAILSTDNGLTGYKPWSDDLVGATGKATLEQTDYYKIRQMFILYDDDGTPPKDMTADGWTGSMTGADIDGWMTDLQALSDQLNTESQLQQTRLSNINQNYNNTFNGASSSVKSQADLLLQSAQIK